MKKDQKKSTDLIDQDMVALDSKTNKALPPLINKPDVGFPDPDILPYWSDRIFKELKGERAALLLNLSSVQPTESEVKSVYKKGFDTKWIEPLDWNIWEPTYSENYYRRYRRGLYYLLHQVVRFGYYPDEAYEKLEEIVRSLNEKGEISSLFSQPDLGIAIIQVKELLSEFTTKTIKENIVDIACRVILTAYFYSETINSIIPFLEKNLKNPLLISRRSIYYPTVVELAIRHSTEVLDQTKR